MGRGSRLTSWTQRRCLLREGRGDGECGCSPVRVRDTIGLATYPALGIRSRYRKTGRTGAIRCGAFHFSLVHHAHRKSLATFSFYTAFGDRLLNLVHILWRHLFEAPRNGTQQSIKRCKRKRTTSGIPRYSFLACLCESGQDPEISSIVELQVVDAAYKLSTLRSGAHRCPLIHPRPTPSPKVPHMLIQDWSTARCSTPVSQSPISRRTSSFPSTFPLPSIINEIVRLTLNLGCHGSETAMGA